jgi:S-DNA-T family DNA segregation ATPase FtsK/SpoIIIE
MSQASWKKNPRPLAPRLMRLVREVGLYLLVALAGYLTIALWTYAPSDPAWSHSGAGGVVRNAGGPVGAWLADVLLHLFGFFAFLFPAMAAFAGWRLFRHRRSGEPPDLRHQALTVGGFVLALAGGGGLGDLHFGQLAVGLPFRAGGVLGEAVGAGLTGAFSFVGATLFLLTMFVSGVTLATGLSWLWLMDALGRWGLAGARYLQQRFSVAADRAAGWQARRVRREVVAEEARVLEAHPPPRIEPVIRHVPVGARVEREKQVALFQTETSGELPPLALLDAPPEKAKPSLSTQSLETLSRLVEKKLLDFGIEVQVVAVHPGPVITRFELETAPGVKASQITNVARDLARALSVVSLRVVENIPGRPTVGLEIPNESRETVCLSEILSSRAYEEAHGPLPLALGKDIGGSPVIADLTKMPHLLIAGTTGSGKSVCIHALVLSLLYKAGAEQVRFIMIDPKMLELGVYEGIPHLLAPVVIDMKQAASALRWCIAEMERRYRLMAALGVRNIAGYNNSVRAAEKDGRRLPDPLAEPAADEALPALQPLPYIVIVIDELADLMMVAGKKVEELIARLAQKARAAGLHLVVATQRPSVDVITGLIKANIAARVAFQMSSRVDSRTVLDQMGAEQLLGHGDMLFLQPGTGVPQRVHGAFVSDQEVHQVVGFLRKTGAPHYDTGILSGEAEAAGGEGFLAGLEGGGGEGDPLYDEALKIVLESRRASISSVQRRLRIGYNRAARLIEEMERAGIVGPLQPNGSREVLVPARAE